MKNFFLKRLLAFIAKKTDGYKTKIGSAGLILSGIVGLLGVMYPDQGLPQMSIEASLAMIGGGTAALGIGDKIQKNTAALTPSPTVEKQGTAD